MKPVQGWLSEELGVGLQPGKLEEEGYYRGFSRIAGLDEVGRGPLAGPVVAAAVILPGEFLVSGFGLRVKGFEIDPSIDSGSTLRKLERVENRKSKIEIRDSKLLTAKKREALAQWIQDRALGWGLGMVSAEEIDRMNVLQASLLAMARALKQLTPAPDYLLIDGPHKIPVEFLQEESSRQQATGNRQHEQQKAIDVSRASRLAPHAFPFQRAIKRGDQLSVSIAAASIVAKVARDRMMAEYDEAYPGYGFGKHKGYGTSLHLAALVRLGPSPIHRRSFRPVRECSGLAVSSEQSAGQPEEPKLIVDD